MTHIQVAMGSSEYLDIPATANLDLNVVGTVQVAFARGTWVDLPDNPTWITGTPIVADGVIRVQYGVDFGPLPRGRYTWFIKIDQSAEIPIEQGKNLLVVY